MDLLTIEKKIRCNEELPVLPELVEAVFRTTEDSANSYRELEDLVLLDPALTAKMIRLANSPYYGGRQITSVHRALTVLGTTKVRCLLMALVFQQMSEVKLSTCFRRQSFWSHSLAVAIASRALSRNLFPHDGDVFYSAGIMHDIGVLVMDKYAPVLLDRVISLADASKVTFWEAEKMISDFDHAEVGGILAHHWGMDQLIVSAITNHHGNSSYYGFEMQSKIVRVANEFAYLCGYPNQTARDTPPDCYPSSLEEIGISETEILLLKDEVTREIKETEAAFLASS